MTGKELCAVLDELGMTCAELSQRTMTDPDDIARMAIGKASVPAAVAAYLDLMAERVRRSGQPLSVLDPI